MKMMQIVDCLIVGNLVLQLQQRLHVDRLPSRMSVKHYRAAYYVTIVMDL